MFVLNILKKSLWKLANEQRYDEINNQFLLFALAMNPYPRQLFLRLCEYAGPMQTFIRKSDRHERVIAENVMKFNDMPQSFLCDNYLENKFINRTICNVYFNNAQKLVNSQVRREVVQQSKESKGSDDTYDWNITLRL